MSMDTVFDHVPHGQVVVHIPLTFKMDGSNVGSIVGLVVGALHQRIDTIS